MDSSRSRMAKLRDVISWYVPGAFDSSSDNDHPIKLINEDGKHLGKLHPNRYDKVCLYVGEVNYYLVQMMTLHSDSIYCQRIDGLKPSIMEYS